MKTSCLEFILSQYEIKGRLKSVELFGCGRINDTYHLIFSDEKGEEQEFLLQKINTYVFPKVYELMENIDSVTEFLKTKITQNGGNPEREVLNIKKSKNDTNYVEANGNSYRIYLFIKNSKSLEKASNEIEVYECALAYGKFQNMLNDYPVETLHDILPNFHNTKKRFNDFIKVVKQNEKNRAKLAKDQIKFVLSNKKYANVIVDMLNNDLIPTRVTHNDTKINNILFDKTLNIPLAVVDLDTVMTGAMAYDFGDAIRSLCNTSSEDETDLSKVNFNLKYFKAYTDGFLKGVGGNLSNEELCSLAISPLVLTYECGLRFLTDYLQGDIYFNKIDHENQNLDRAKNQFKLFQDMEENFESLQTIVFETYNKLNKKNDILNHKDNQMVQKFW